MRCSDPPTGVLTTRSQRPRRTRSTTVGPSPPRSTLRDVAPPRAPLHASVARRPVRSRRARIRARRAPPPRYDRGLVLVAHREEHGARAGSGRPAARSAFANAVGRSAALAITSPVERISGPRTGSAPGKRANGSTAALTLTCFGGRSAGSAVVQRRPGGEPAGRRDQVRHRSPSRRTAPSATRAGSPRARTRRPRQTASRTLTSRTVPSAGARRRTMSLISRACVDESDGAGSTQAESPECTPPRRAGSRRRRRSRRRRTARPCSSRSRSRRSGRRARGRSNPSGRTSATTS